MAQLHGQVVTDDDKRIGVVKSVTQVTRKQPDLLKKDAETREVLERIKQDPIKVSSATVVWEDGTESTLVEGEHEWTVLGSVVKFDVDLDPEGKSKLATNAIGDVLANV